MNKRRYGMCGKRRGFSLVMAGCAAILAGPVHGLAPTAGATPEPWQLWDYAVAARCVWEGDKARISDAIDAELAQRSTNELNVDLFRCKEVDGLKGRSFDRADFVRVLIAQAYVDASPCALRNLPGMTMAEMRDQYIAFGKRGKEYSLPAPISAAFAACNARLSAWYADPMDRNREMLSTMMGQRVWQDQLATWSKGLTKRTPADRIGLCLLRNNESGVIWYLAAVRYGDPDQMNSRARDLFPRITEPCGELLASVPDAVEVLGMLVGFYTSYFATLDRAVPKIDEVALKRRIADGQGQALEAAE